ncbi:unnamed protein product (mitochondrion) [Plasmodiophora brassicae]|nr:unnamed protein product [Plasmodiophora brassicae]
MRAVRVDEFGDSSALSCADVDVPRVGPNQVLVQMSYAGVNFVDIYNRTGLYPLALPFTIGKEGSGVIVARGASVSEAEFPDGHRVSFVAAEGTYAEYVVVDADKTMPVPAGVSLEQAAAVGMQGLTAHYLVTSTYPVQQGDLVLIHAGAGGTGSLLVQMAKQRGARVLTTVSSEKKAEIARRNGADHVIIYTECEFDQEVRKVTDGVGVHVVYDSVGASTWEKSLACLRCRGHLVLFGNASGPVPPIDPLRLCRSGSITLVRPTLAHYVTTRADLLDRIRDIYRWVAAGTLDVHIGRILPLGDAAKAQDLLAARKTTGKILLQVDTDDVE